jgi:diguanylate cyclase (GGDEF)-like protein
MVSEACDLTSRLCAELPGALRGGQLVGYFQPEVELSTGRLVAAGLLARWEHAELGVLPPGLFLPLAEQLGLTGELTCLMLRQALEQHRAWADAGRVVPVSVSVGPGCVADPAFPAAVAGFLREERVPGQMLALEVSGEAGAAGSSFFAELAGLGVRVRLGGFGAGAASPEGLGGWPVSELKLDESVVRPMAGNAGLAAIVRETVGVARQLGVTVVADGVESEAVSCELRAAGCGIGQGPFLGEPMPAAAFTAWLAGQDRPVPGRSGGGPARRIAHGATGAARRAVQLVGGATLAAAATVLAAYGAWQVFRWGGREHQALIGNLAFLSVDSWVALLAWRVSRRADLGRRTCRAWRLIFAAGLCFMAGHLLRLMYGAVLHANGEPHWIRAVFAGASVFTAIGLIAFPARRRSGPERVRLILDTGTVFLGGAVLIWYVALRDAGSARTGLIPFADAIGGMLVLFGVLSVLARGTTTASVAALRILAAGVVAAIVDELAYGLARSSYRVGDPLDTLGMAAVIATWLALACQLRAAAADGEIGTPPKPASRHPPILPYLAIAGSYLLLLIVGRHIIRADPLGIVLLGAVVLTLLVSARQYITLRDYGQLAVRYQELAAIDGMTGLYNRRHFMETAQAAFAHARQAGQPLVALMIDVDNFKQVNDVHGHVVGDQVLTEVAQACRDHVRPADIAGRYGGDEFTIMSPGMTSLRATRLAAELARPPARVLGRDGRPLAYTLSIGIAQCPPGGNLSALLVHADLAMYEAKRAGGNCWRIYGATTGAGPAGTRHPTATQAPPAAGQQSATTQ